MIGYQARADKFGWFALTLVLMDACGGGLGVFVSCLFNDLSGGEWGGTHRVQYWAGRRMWANLTRTHGRILVHADASAPRSGLGTFRTRLPACGRMLLSRGSKQCSSTVGAAASAALVCPCELRYAVSNAGPRSKTRCPLPIGRPTVPACKGLSSFKPRTTTT